MRGKGFYRSNDSVLMRLMLGISLMLACFNSYALTSTEYTFDELVARSDRILVGTVNSIDSFWGLGRAADTIFSHIQLTDLESIKGDLPQGDYRLRVIGGVVGDQAQFYPGLPQFVVGQRYLLFIKGNNRSMFPITGASQGFYLIQWDADQQRQIAIPAAGGGQPLTRQAHSHNHAGQPQALETLIGQIRSRLPQGEQ